MDGYELLSSEHFHVILHSNKKNGLIFNRLDETVTTINYDDAKELSNLNKVGRIYGIVGRYLNKYLVLIKNRSFVGSLYEPRSKTEHKIYVITQVQVIDISCPSSKDQTDNSTKTSSVRYDVGKVETGDSNDTSDAKASTKTPIDHDDFSSLPITISTSSYTSMQSRGPWNPFKLANSFKPKMPSQLLRTSAADSTFTEAGSSQQGIYADDSVKRLVEEMIKLFNSTNSFYFSPSLDLTNRFSRKTLVKSSCEDSLWKTADERFFWNKYMLNDLIELSEKDKDANYFICVILQGFIAIENHTVSVSSSTDFDTENLVTAPSGNSDCDKETTCSNEKDPTKSRIVTRNYQIALISRRSVFQAGTRYRRRGCDKDGNVANFVETEQIFRHNQHFTSVVLVRGSIPLFWYQSGYNYRPPPVLYRSEEENHKAFTKHFVNLMKLYETDQIISIDCTEQSGREKAIHDAYKRHMEELWVSHSNIKYIEFDFHKHCRGRQCSYAQVEKHLKSCGLTDELVKGVRYYWNDGEIVWNQDGVFRVNCLDCSDRTNVVQRAIALQIFDLQLARLGVIAPDTSYEDNDFRKIMHIMWATNGNVLSTQYCGTRALFSEDAKLSGYLKDTYSSASRYYISKFRDAYRQAAIDAMLGVESIEKNLSTGEQKDHQGSGIDQYELINLEPILAARTGGALLKDVGNRVSNRLARLKGKFYVKPPVFGDVLASKEEGSVPEETDPELIEATVGEALESMNIDWPSSESVENNDNQTNNAFAQMAQNDDSFQDDEFGQLMLSIDIAELQRLRDDEGKSSNERSTDKSKSKNCEEFIMTESCGIKSTSSSDTNTEMKTSTTST